MKTGVSKYCLRTFSMHSLLNPSPTTTTHEQLVPLLRIQGQAAVVFEVQIAL